MNANLTRVVLLGFLGLAVAAGIGMGLGKETKLPEMSFFITSSASGRGGDLGGLAGADARCTALAAKAHVADKDWHAYLSTAPVDGQPGIDARDRIGQGPWFNAKGVQIASSLADLHGAANNLNKQTAVDELGHTIKGRGDTPNTHDILTGSTADGRLAQPAPGGPADMTCGNWTSNGAGKTLVGHHDRQGGGPAPTSWNSAHPTNGCSQPDLVATGGAGLFYCFAK
jgi:hypothetical protein